MDQLETSYENVDGYSISRKVKKRMRDEGFFEETEGLTYGEVRIDEFAALLHESITSFAPNAKTFADIGSGTGKAVFAAAIAMNSKLESFIGVEIVEELHDTAVRVLDDLKGSNAIKGIEFHFGDSFEIEDKWVHADVIFAPTTCFTDDLMSRLEQALEKLAPGTLVITTTRKLKCKRAEKLLARRCKYAKGSLEFMVWKIN